MIRQLLIILTSLSLPFCDIISIRYNCFHEEMGPTLYGFPFIYRTEIPWVNSFEGNLYILGFIGNVLFYFLIINLIIIGLKRINEKIISNRIIKIGSIIFSMPIIFVGVFNIFIYEWELYFTTEEILKYADEPLNCMKELIFFGR